MIVEIPDVRVNQVWADNDTRCGGRHILVIGIEPAVPAGPHKRAVPAKAVVAFCTVTGTVIRVNGKDTRTRIAIKRFRPASNGYRLVRDPDHQGASGSSSANPKLVTADRAKEIVDAGGAVHRDERYTGDYRYIVDDMGNLGTAVIVDDPAPTATCPSSSEGGGGPMSQPTDYTAKLFLQATEAVPGILTAAAALDFTVRQDAACYDLVAGPIAGALTEAGAACCLEDQLGLTAMMLAELARRYTDLRDRVEAHADGHLFGAAAHMIHGVHHKVGECTWPEVQCTGHLTTVNAPNQGAAGR